MLHCRVTINVIVFSQEPRRMIRAISLVWLILFVALKIVYKVLLQIIFFKKSIGEIFYLKLSEVAKKKLTACIAQVMLPFAS